MHQHQCGLYEPGDPKDVAILEREGPGCGEIWEHEGIGSVEILMLGPVLAREYNDDMHICPNCGKGPWLVKYRVPQMPNTSTSIIRR